MSGSARPDRNAPYSVPAALELIRARRAPERGEPADWGAIAWEAGLVASPRASAKSVMAATAPYRWQIAAEALAAQPSLRYGEVEAQRSVDFRPGTLKRRIHGATTASGISVDEFIGEWREGFKAQMLEQLRHAGANQAQRISALVDRLITSAERDIDLIESHRALPPADMLFSAGAAGAAEQLALLMLDSDGNPMAQRPNGAGALNLVQRGEKIARTLSTLNDMVKGAPAAVDTNAEDKDAADLQPASRDQAAEMLERLSLLQSEFGTVAGPQLGGAKA